MLDIVSLAEQTLTSGSNIAFDTNRVATSCTAQHLAGSPSIVLNRPGYYYVSFNTIAVASEATETEPITVQLYNEDDVIEGAVASELSAASTDTVNLSFSTIGRVRPSCCIVDNTGILTFKSTGADAVFTTPNVVVFYID